MQRDAPTSMVDRVALILNSLEAADKPLPLDQVADQTGLPRSSAHRILTQLHGAGLLHHRSTGYCLASAPRGDDHSQLRAVASPVLERLRTDTALAVHLGVLRGADVLCLDRLSGDSVGVAPLRVASHTPAHASALGKAMLAQLSPSRWTTSSLPRFENALRRRSPTSPPCIRSWRGSDHATASPTTTRSWPSGSQAWRLRSRSPAVRLRRFR